MDTANTEDMLLAVVAKGGDGTEADLWSEYNFRSNDIEGYTEGTADINTTEVAASRHVISVGNYDATNDTGEMGAIDMTSSFGTMLDGTSAPVSDNAWYTLEGIRLAGKPTAKGLYVNRGRIYIK